MPTSAPTRVGIIGCGIIAGQYARSLSEYPEIQLTGVTDVNLAASERLAAAHSVRQYADLAELLADEAVDIVVNLTPNDAHAPITRVALRAGVHVYSEKPLALTLADAEALRDLARGKRPPPGLLALHLFGRGATDSLARGRHG